MRALIASLALVPSLSAQSKVWVVDDGGGPGIDFTKIQPAIAAAADGDIVLVRSGDYAAFDVQSKALALIADADADVTVTSTVTVQPSATVRQLAADRAVLLDGLTIRFPWYWAVGLLCQDNLGTVWLQRCRQPAGYAGLALKGQAAVRAIRCASIVARDCTMQGQSGFDPSLSGGPGYGGGDGESGGSGLEASAGTRCALFGSKAFGGSGGSSNPGSGGVMGGLGGAGVRLEGASLLFAAGARIQAGFPGYGYGFDPYYCVGSWPAITQTPDDAAWLLDSVVLEMLCYLSSPPPTPVGTIVWLPGPYRGLRAKSVLREGASGTIDLFGAPGDLFQLLAASAPAPAIGGVTSGPLVLAAPMQVLASGALTAAGTLSLPYTIQELGAGVEGAVAYLQPLFVEPATSKFAFGAPLAVVLLDASF